MRTYVCPILSEPKTLTSTQRKQLNYSTGHKKHKGINKTNATHSHKSSLKSLGLIRVTGKEVKDDHYVLHLTPT